MTNNALIVKNLGKMFKLYSSPKERLQDWLSINPKYRKEFWALKDINFEVQKGEFFGILGLNGAGKSTLLKLVAGILIPTEGEIETNGTILSIFGLSLGNSDDLTGRENILNRAKILGFSKKFIQEKMDDIIEFSELGEFIDYPVGNYSSGMKSRLNFSLYSLLNADLLVLDEVLAVGDIFFKQKCYQRMSELNASGTSIILVTHSTASIRQYCTRAMVLDKGKQVFIGNTQEAVHYYTRINKRSKTVQIDSPGSITKIKSTDEKESRNWYGISFKRPEINAEPILDLPIRKEHASLIDFGIYNEMKKPTTVFFQGERISIYYSFELNQKILNPFGRIAIVDIYGNLIHSKTTYQLDAETPKYLMSGDIIRFLHQVQLDIKTRTYFLGLRLGSYIDGKEDVIFGLNNFVNFEVIPSQDDGNFPYFGGLCDLQSSTKTEWYSIDSRKERING
jgi:ABC-type polysaccharide/polyol phosphate transport system ATPase subunit